MVIAEEIDPRSARAGRLCRCTATSSCPTSPRSGTTSRSGAGCPGLVSGELISAIAMTEPGAGSDLQGIRTTRRRRGRPLRAQRLEDLHHQRHPGRPRRSWSPAPIPTRATRASACSSSSAGMEGFERGRNLDKVGLHAQDTAELFFDRRTRAQGEPARRGGLGLRLPDGEPAPGAHLDRRHRRRGVRARPRAVPRVRQASARPSASRSASSSTTGSCWPRWPPRPTSRGSSSTTASLELNAGEVDTALASMAKWWTTELQNKLVDQGVQLHGGYGYMLGVPHRQGLRRQPRSRRSTAARPRSRRRSSAACSGCDRPPVSRQALAACPRPPACHDSVSALVD